MVGKLETLIAEAADKHAALRALEGDDSQLSIKGYLAAIVELGADPDRAEKVAAAMQTPEGEPLRGPYHRLRRAITEWRRTSAIKKLRGFFSDEAFAILCGRQWTMADLYWLAARDVARLHPELFGKVDSRPAHQKSIESLRAELGTLMAEIPNAWNATDVNICKRTGGVTFKCTGGAVALHPIDHLAQRLVDWWIENRSAAPAKRKAA